MHHQHCFRPNDIGLGDHRHQNMWRQKNMRFLARCLPFLDQPNAKQWQNERGSGPLDGFRSQIEAFGFRRQSGVAQWTPRNPTFATELWSTNQRLKHFVFILAYCFLWSSHHTGAKILNLSENSHFESLIFDKIHIWKISFFTKFTFGKSHSS